MATEKKAENNYYNYLNQNLLNHLKDEIAYVLDVGCGSGALGEKYKESNDKTVWHGIDIHKPSITKAKKGLDGAWVMDANNIKPNATMKKHKYDALIYSLSLEQLEDPALAIKEHAKLLKEAGKIYICFPNVQHWSLIRHVISGNWDYSDRGILQTDNQHQFTRKSFTRMLESADLKSTDIFRYSYENTPLFQKRRGTRIQTISKLKEFCEKTKLEFNENDFRTYHYVMIAEKK